MTNENFMWIIITIVTVASIIVLLIGCLLCIAKRNSRTVTICTIIAGIFTAIGSWLSFIEPKYNDILKSIYGPKVEIDESTLELKVGDGYNLNVTVSPEQSTLEWESDNTGIIEINNGYLRAISEGTATVTATILFYDTPYSDSCTITVSMPTIEIIDENTGNVRSIFIDDSSVPVSERALIPENSLYPDINMEAISTLSGSGRYDGYDGKSRASDCVTYAFTKSTIDSTGLFNELECEILKNPIVGDMVARGIVNEYNEIVVKEPWIQEFITITEKAYALPDDAMFRGLDCWVTGYKFTDEEMGLFVTNEYRKYAELLCQLLESFTNYGVHTFESKIICATNIVGDVSKRRVTIRAGSPKTPALILYKIDENEKIVCVIGFDLDDKSLFTYSSDVIQIP